VGLGHEFLRHIVRCKLLLFVLDMAGSEGRNPLQDLGTLREELKMHDPTLAKREVDRDREQDGSAGRGRSNLKGGAFKRRFRKREGDTDLLRRVAGDSKR